MMPTYTLSDHVRATSGPRGTVLLDLTAGLYYHLNPTGSRIWQGLAQGWSVGRISAGLARDARIDADRAAADCEALIEQLVAARLVHPSETP